MKSITSCLASITILLFALSACAPVATPLLPTPTSTSTPIEVPGGKSVIGYYPSWAAERDVLAKDIPAQKLTHINYAFSNVSENGECILGDPAADVETVYTKEDSANAKDDSKSAAFHGNF